MIFARIETDSISITGKRLVTLVCSYPRFVHAELMTHRVFSRNAASSRAIPIDRFIDRMIQNPAMPVYWGANKPGMQAVEEVADPAAAREWWLETRDLIVERMRVGQKLGLHKEVLNRIGEPWFMIETIITATEFDNFFALRLDKDAQREIRSLALAMNQAMEDSTPMELSISDWHLPFVSDEEAREIGKDVARKVSVARCARVSYLNHDGSKPSVEKDIILHDRLLAGGHMSPFEHQATPARSLVDEPSGNLRGWVQYRKMIPGEDVFRKE